MAEATPLPAVPFSDGDGSKLGRNADLGLAGGLNFFRRHSRRDLAQDQALRSDVVEAQLGDDAVDALLARDRQPALLEEFLRAVLCHLLHGDQDALRAADQVHGAAHSFDDLAGDGPVGQIAVLAHLHGAENGDVDMPAADHGERIGAGEVGSAFDFGDRLLTGVDQVGVELGFGRIRPDSEHTVLRLEDDVDAFGDVVGNHGRNADSEVDVVPVLQFPGGARRDLAASEWHGLRGPQGALLDPLLVVAALEDALHIDRRNVNAVGLELAYFDQVLHFGDGDARGGAHHRREVPRRLSKDQIPPLVALPGPYDCIVGFQRGLEDHLPAVDDPRLFSFRDLRARSRRGEEAAQARATRADALGQRALRVELHLQLTGEILPLELLVLADIARDHLLDLLALEKDAEALVVGPAVVGDHRQVLHAFLVNGGDQVLGIAAKTEAAGENDGAVLHVGNGFIRASDHLVHWSRSTINAMPSQPPMQSEASPRFLFKSFIA